MLNDMGIRGTVLTVTVVVACLPLPARGQCASWAPGVNLSSSDGRYAVDGHAVIDAAGKVHIIYQDFLWPAGYNYYITNVSGSWSAKVNLGSMSDKGSAPKIVITPDQKLHAFYGKNDLYWRTKPVSGGSWSSPVLLTSGSFIYNAVVDNTGGIYFVYGHLFDAATNPRNGIWGRYLPLGGSWGGNELVYGNTDDGNWPKCSAVAVRGATVWVSIETNSSQYIKRRPAGGPWAAGTGALFSTDGGAMQIAFSPTTSEVVAMYHQDVGCCETGPWYELFARYSYDDGATWSADQNISAMTDDIDRNPEIVYDYLGNLHVVWEGFCCDHKSRVRYRGRIGGTWGDIITLVPSGTTGLAVGALQSSGSLLTLTYAASGSPGVVGNYDEFFTSMNPSQPVIHVQPASLSRSVWVGGSLSNDTFTIVNGCPGTLSYTITDNLPWMQEAPMSGSSTTDIDTITISYPGVSQALAGTYAATVTVSGNAANSPVTIPVTVTVQTVKPDQDGDGDVDQADFGLLQACFTGAFNPQNDPACQRARLDADDDVDADDVTIFLQCISGPTVPAVRTCAG